MPAASTPRSGTSKSRCTGASGSSPRPGSIVIATSRVVGSRSRVRASARERKRWAFATGARATRPHRHDQREGGGVPTRPDVVGEQDGAELEEPVGWVFEDAEDRYAFVDGEADLFVAAGVAISRSVWRWPARVSMSASSSRCSRGTTMPATPSFEASCGVRVWAPIGL